jgi:hypothetical protein
MFSLTALLTDWNSCPSLQWVVEGQVESSFESDWSALAPAGYFACVCHQTVILLFKRWSVLMEFVSSQQSLKKFVSGTCTEVLHTISTWCDAPLSFAKNANNLELSWMLLHVPSFHPPNYMVLHPIRQQSSYSLPWEPEISPVKRFTEMRNSPTCTYIIQHNFNTNPIMQRSSHNAFKKTVWSTKYFSSQPNWKRALSWILRCTNTVLVTFLPVCNWRQSLAANGGST